MTPPKEKLAVLNAKLAFAISADEPLDAVYDVANCALIPLQRIHAPADGHLALIDYSFGEPIVSPSPVEGYDYENGFDLPRWEVQTRIGFDAWENVWMADAKPQTFESELAAKAAVFDFLTDVLESGMEPYDVEDFRVRLVGDAS